MPGPSKLSYLTQPLVPESAVRPLQDAIDSPSLERSPWEARLRGFGAGALEGLRQQTTPLNLAGLVGGGVSKGIQAIGRGASVIPEALQGLRGVSHVAAETPELGALAAEYAPVGGEELFNAGRSIAKVARDPAEAAYHNILARGGR